jgi:amidase
MEITILKEAFDMPILDGRVKDAAVLAAAHKFSSISATVSEVSIPFHPLGNAIWTIEQRISGCLTLQGKSHGRRGYGRVGLEAGKHPWTRERFEKCFPTTMNVFLNGIYLMDKFPTFYSKLLNLSRKFKNSYEEVLMEYDDLILQTRLVHRQFVYNNQDDQPNGGPYCQCSLVLQDGLR